MGVLVQQTQVAARSAQRFGRLGGLAAVPSIACYSLPMPQYLLQLLGDLGLQGEALPSGEVLVVPRACQTPRLLFLAHHDEVGFLIRQVEGEYAWLDPIGSVGLEMLSSASLDIHTVNGVVRG